MSTQGEMLESSVWQERQRAHEQRIRAWTDPHQQRLARGEKHPVYDFLFEYYAFRPSWLRRWHPGLGATLLGADARTFLDRPEYKENVWGVAADPSSLPAHRRETVFWLRSLLTNMTARPPFFGCFGLHEWAMVYRQKHDETRHARWPMRLSQEDIVRVVEAQPLHCTHYDAFRFFTEPARPKNRWPLARENVSDHEQRGCLHANMDLYKWSFKLAPFTPSELVADAFSLARDIRAVDMRASPYDFTELGFTPIAIETPAGRAAYESAQRDFAARAEPIRERLIVVCDQLIQAWTENAVVPRRSIELAE